MADAPEPTEPTPPDRIPPGCNPLVFGLIAATIQMAVLLYFLYR